MGCSIPAGFQSKHMPGHYGVERDHQNLEIVKVDAERNLLLIRRGTRPQRRLLGNSCKRAPSASAGTPASAASREAPHNRLKKQTMPKTALYNLYEGAIGEVGSATDFRRPVVVAAMHLVVRSILASKRQANAAAERFAEAAGRSPPKGTTTPGTTAMCAPIQTAASCSPQAGITR